MQPWVTRMPTPAGRFVPWMRYPGSPKRMACLPSGFFGPGGTTGGYLSKPESGEGPGIIVLQEWWGLVGHIKNVADRFAAAGYVALAPDLYHGESTKSPDDAGKLMMALNIEQTEKDLAGAVDYLGDQASGDKIGIIGFCMGGQLALFGASKNPRIGACVDLYGVQEDTVWIEFSTAQIAELGFSFSDIRDVLISENVVLPGGTKDALENLTAFQYAK